MAFEKITDTSLANKGVTGLPDVPGLSTAEMQAKFDELSRDVIIPKLNEIVDGLNGDEVGLSSKIENPETKEKDVIQNVVNAIYQIVKENSDKRHGHENKETLDKVTAELYDSITALVSMFNGISAVDKTVTADDTKIPTSGAIVNYAIALGAGDMQKAIYDKNNTGIVDDAEKLGGVAPEEYLQKASLPDATVEFDVAETRSNISTGEKVSTVFGKIKKFFADLTAPAFAQMITTKEDLLATKVTGYVPDAKAVADGFADVNGNLVEVRTDVSQNSADIQTIASAQIPESTVSNAVKNYVNSHSGEFATKTDVSELKSDLDYQNENISNGEGKIFEYVAGRTHVTDYDRSLCTMSAEAPKAMYGNGFTADDDLLLTKIHIDANTIRVLVNTIDDPYDWTVYSDVSVTDGVANVSIPVKKGQSVFVGWQDGTVQYSPNISGFECVAYRNYQSSDSKITISALASFNLEYSYYDKTEWYDLDSHIYRKDKTWLAVGDSITVGETNNGKSYVDYISEALKITVIKEGHSGWSFSRLVQNFASFDVDNSADIITIFAGTNDFNASKGAGTETDKWTSSTETIWALCNFFMPYIQNRYPTKPIIFFTPIQRQYHGEDTSSITTMTDANGVTLQEYGQAFIDAGKKYGIPVIDLYSISGIGVNNINDMTNDGLHPNEIGQKRIANIILSEIMKYTQIN